MYATEEIKKSVTKTVFNVSNEKKYKINYFDNK